MKNDFQRLLSVYYMPAPEKISALLETISSSLKESFNAVDTWFDKGKTLRLYKPRQGRSGSCGWSINEILEHISLTNHFLLILIQKGSTKAIKNTNNLDLAKKIDSYEFQKEKLDQIGQLGSFNWIRPEHMEPTGKAAPQEVRTRLKQQLNDCLGYLSKLRQGEGLLYKTSMSVNNLGKINVYEYIYFLSRHARRHVSRMVQIEKEYLELKQKTAKGAQFD